MIVSSLETAGLRPRKLAVGEFDGVHLGHRSVIEKSDCVLTFEPHPRAVVGPTGAPPLLTTLDQKRDAIEALGVEELVVARFDRAFSEMPAERFISDVLVAALGAVEVSVGANFRFGAKAIGDAGMLAADGRFETRVADLVTGELGSISSSRIRGYVTEGDMRSAAVMLGRDFEIRGVVQHGEKRGRELGYPTANIAPRADCVMPAFGIYACLADGMPSVASLGVRPTFEDAGAALLEVHVLDFEGDLYDRELRVEMIERIRPELRFDSSDALVEQMERDAADADRICRAHAIAR